MYIDHNSYKISLPLKSIITYSENLPPEYRSKIANVFSCPVFDLFSQWEGVCLISECEQNQLHQHMEYSAMELLDKNNQPVGEKVEGEITATSFYNYSMPFIRYKTGDLATWGNRTCGCGMGHKVVDNISGRMVYVLFDTEGNLVPFQKFQIYSFVSDEYAEGLFQAQIVQDSLDEVKVYLVVNNRSNTERIEKEFTKSIKSRLGDEMNIEFVYADSVPKRKNGKTPFVRNNLLNKV
jgi:phenylacetate-CoA ligase